MKRCVLALLVNVFAATALAQTNPAAHAARTCRQQHERAIVDEFVSTASMRTSESKTFGMASN
jgi:hypothetical protein